MKIKKQRDLFEKDPEHAPGRHTHGGGARISRRKTFRPLNEKRPVHLVLKSTHARGSLNFLAPKNLLAVEKTLIDRARQFGVKVHSKEIMFNHIHLVASFSKRRGFQDFLRTVTALIARKVTGATKGRPFGKRFWNDLAFTRVVFGRRDFRGLLGYMNKNRIEREVGAIARTIVEEFEEAERKARRRGCDVWEILDS